MFGGDIYVNVDWNVMNELFGYGQYQGDWVGLQFVEFGGYGYGNGVWGFKLEILVFLCLVQVGFLLCYSDVCIVFFGGDGYIVLGMVWGL